MSARPSILQFLQHGKLLCGKVFGGFVETWNYIVESFDNFKGEADLDPENGIIYIDRADATHPVIRVKSDRIKALVRGSGDGGGGGGGGGDDSGDDSGVRSLNGLDGNLVLLGGPKIRISKDEKSGEITIAFDETKDETDDPSAAPEDPCAHPGNPGNQNHGGVAVEWSSPVAGGAAVDASAGNGGVAAGGDSHIGDNNCNC